MFLTLMTSSDALYSLWNLNFLCEKNFVDKILMSSFEQDFGKHKPNRWMFVVCRLNDFLFLFSLNYSFFILLPNIPTFK